jgi:hypothetical protein
MQPPIEHQWENVEKTCLIVDTAGDNEWSTQKKMASRDNDGVADELILRMQGFIAEADMAPILHRKQ